MTALVLLGERCTVEPVRLGSARFLKVTLRRKGLTARLAARRIARRLCAENIEKAAFVKGFPYTDVFRRYGVASMDIRPLRLAAAAEIVCAALRGRGVEPGEAFVAVRAPQMNGEVGALVTALSRRVRYLSLDAQGREVAAEQLRFHHGVALREGESGAQIVLSLCEGERCAGKTLALFDEALRVSYAFDAPLGGFEVETLLAAFFSEGAIAAEELAVLGVAASPS